MKRISVIGLGYVGLTSALGLTKLGHNVIGVDINEDRIAEIKLKRSPLKVGRLEAHLKKYPFECSLDGHREAVMKSDISFVCVETPCKDNGSLDLMPLKKACRTIGDAIRDKDYHIIVIRSTMFPGSLEILKTEIEKHSGKVCGRGFDLAVNPEFLREKYAIKDFFNPTYIIIGSDNHGIGERVLGCYDGIDAKKFIVETGLAQMIKYVCNSYHGLKVAYTNEVGNLCKELGIDGEKLMEIFVQDTKLNISPYYHIPGEAFGGHCLPKDLSVLQKKSKELKIKSPIIDAISKSNDIQKRKDKKEKVSHLQ